jgi:hypothetical protein
MPIVPCSRSLPPAAGARRLALSLLAILAGGVPAAAQEPSPAAAPPELVTDRPDQTESAAVVPPGTVQLETGVDHAEEGGGPDAESDALGSTLLRVGLVEGLELRLGWGGWARDREAAGGEVEGTADGEIGFKVALWEARGRRPQAALLGGVSLPVGADRLSSGRHDASLRLSLAHDLPRGTSLGYNLGMAWAGEESRLEYTAAFGFPLGPRVGGFVELFGDGLVDEPAGGPSTGSAHAVDGGLTFLLRDRLQLDLAVGAGLTDQAPDRFLTAGLSVRWPR